MVIWQAYNVAHILIKDVLPTRVDDEVGSSIDPNANDETIGVQETGT